MKYIIFSFDDGRLDTYTRAIPVMLKYNIKATINITTDFILNPNKYFPSSRGRAMSIGMIKKAESLGFEIACHSHTHCNDIEDIRYSLSIMKEWGIKKSKLGFASPYSDICSANFDKVKELIENDEIEYIRTGIQVRREGYFYAFLYVLQDIMRSRFLFYGLNKSQIIKQGKNKRYFIGININSKTTVEQIKYFIKKMPNESGAVFIMHSVFKMDDEGRNVDRWHMDYEVFEELCKFLNSNKDIKVVTNSELMNSII